MDNEREILKAHVDGLLKAKGHTPSSASRAIGANVHFVRQWLEGRVRSPGADKLRALAALAGVTLEELLTPPGETGIVPGMAEHVIKPGDFVAPPEALRRQVRAAPVLPVRYIVQAGVWREVDTIGQARLKSPPVSADPSFPASAQWLELVQGDSVDQVYPEGSWVHVVDAIAIGYAPRNEDFVAVERRREQGGFIERSLKQIAIKGRRVELWPRSRNPIWKEPLRLSETESDDTVVEISALVLGGYLPARRS